MFHLYPLFFTSRLLLIFGLLCPCFATTATSTTTGQLISRVYNNTARRAPPLDQGLVSDVIWSGASTTGPCSGELEGSLTFGQMGVYRFDCAFVGTLTGWVWIDGHLVCQDGRTYPHQLGASDNPLNIRHATRTYPFRAHLTAQHCQQASLSVDWQNLIKKGSGSADKDPPPPTMLSPHLPPHEHQREDLQRSLATGWGTWLHADILSWVKLPEGVVLEVRLCRRRRNRVNDDDDDDDDNNATSTAVCTGPVVHHDDTIRVGGLHARDRSYVELYVRTPVADDDNPRNYANVSLEFAAVPPKDDLELLVTTVSIGSDDDSTKDDNEYEIQLRGRYAWSRVGSVSCTDDERLVYESAGLGTLHVSLSSSSGSSGSSTTTCHGTSVLVVPLSKESASTVGFSTRGSNASSIQTLVEQNRQREQTQIKQRFGSDKAAIATAIQAAVMWSSTYVPVENGPLLPVSRAWNCARGDIDSDWRYCTFDWDNLFASLLASTVVSKATAYSNLFQVVKTKTSAGFIPNFYAGGFSSQDRTEPPIGAKVTLELYRKYHDTWMVEVVFDDLLDWNDWFTENRILDPLGLVALGSWNEQAVANEGQGDPGNTMQCSRWESGLDNSPMYDGDLFNTTSHLMQLYDVGFSSLFVQEAHALAELAIAVGRHSTGHILQERGDAMAAKIQKHLWDPVQQIYTNKFVNDTFYRRISPTSFYPLMTGVATDAQAVAMVSNWLLNASRFCISPNGDFADNTDTCFWGLPSISSDDPAYPALGYWRGYIWGPMVQLVHWSLQRYDHVPIVREGKWALSKQMQALMMDQWNRNRHICENYHPHRAFRRCSGTSFYHWGALAGLVGLMEDGHWRDEGAVRGVE